MTDATDTKNNNKKRNLWLIGLGALFLLVGLLWFLWWIFLGRFYVSTEDAYVHGNMIPLNPEVESSVVAIFAEETDLVEQGQLVVQLDTTEIDLRIEELKATLANTTKKVAQLFEAVNQEEASVALRKAQLVQAELDLSHRTGLEDTGAISVEEFEQFRTDVDVSRSALELAMTELVAAQLAVAHTTVETHPRVKEVAAQLREAYLDRIRCDVWAPATGYVANRNVQVGDTVSIGSPMLMIVPLDDLWVEANYKETQLGRVRIGQKVSYWADIYGRSVKFHGHVVGFSAGTGSAFALLPPQNASGNWIKIIQRVPVRISVDPKEIKKHPLLIGLSMHASVSIRDGGGEMLAEEPTNEPIYTTFVFEQQRRELARFEPLIDQLIQTNASL